MEPQHLAKQMAEPERTIHLNAAQVMHDEQESLLGHVKENPDKWQENFITGIAFALEEYWMLELSYPQEYEQLATSGYLLEGWAEGGYVVSCYDDFAYDENLKQLIYVPLPIGLAQLKRVPGMHCAFSRRCFFAYSLIIPEQANETWNGVESLHTHWIEPFLARGFLEVMHVNKEQPGMSGCSMCD